MTTQSASQGAQSYSGSSAGKFASNSVSRNSLGWIFVAQGVSILPLFLFMPLWLLAIWLFAIITRIQIYRGVWPYPGNVLKLCIGLAGVAGLYWSFGGSVSVEPMIGFLLLSFVLKLVEVRRRVDVLVVLYIGFVAVAAQLLLSQTFRMSLYAVLSCVVLLAALQSVFQHRALSPFKQVRDAFMLLLKAVPVMLILFLLMPRLGQFWAVPSMQGAAKTGFSETMSPGDFSRLIQSDDIVFRATFKTAALPPPRERYWRGLVMEQFDGRRWQRFGANWSQVTFGARSAESPMKEWELKSKSDTGKLSNLEHLAEQDKTYHYSVLMEPHNYHWLFVLMAPIEAFSQNMKPRFNPNFLLVNTVPVATRSTYEVLSLPSYRIGATAPNSKQISRNLVLPERGNERARALAKQWREEGARGQELIDRALALYRQSFTYTLQPPQLGANAVDEFLFSTQRGFCEHFASSFVYLMRAAGVPARVVVGYLGGEVKEGGYMVVRQSDAHAWAEVWLPKEGWVRVDPTSAVSPLRIERALHEAVGEDEASMVGGALLRINALRWLSLARNKMEELDYLWQTSVLGYDSEQQAGFFKKYLGGTDPWRLGLFFVAGIGALLLLYYVFSLIKHPAKNQAPELKLLRQVLRVLEKGGLHRQPGETLLAFNERLKNSRPDIAHEFGAIVELYQQVAYQGKNEKLIDLHTRVKQGFSYKAR
ncbi:Transglutaminase-like enzymes, putative cysteine proteases [Alteromonadaceae bacterium Bs31]|nr:Transglutaminase-like enzymes, putative cysteine proteases [Alteromonadaceae bacterium Bs31]